jgi:hypothetical protein
MQKWQKKQASGIQSDGMCQCHNVSVISLALSQNKSKPFFFNKKSEIIS